MGEARGRFQSIVFLSLISIESINFAGDLLLTSAQAKSALHSAVHKELRRVKRKFTSDPLAKWDHTAPIEYSFDGSHCKFLPSLNLVG